MAESKVPFLRSTIPKSASSNNFSRFTSDAHGAYNFRGPGTGLSGLKKRGLGHGNRSWIKIDQSGNSKILELDKATVMRHCSLPARDLRLLDPLFIYPSTLLGREKAIVVSLEQIRCVITADEVILMNSLDGCVLQYKSELCKRLQINKEQSDDLPFEFRALELALELTCLTLDAQDLDYHIFYLSASIVKKFNQVVWPTVKELEMEINPVLDELARSISTLNLERVRRFKGHLLALTQRVQKVCDEIEHLMNDDGDMAEMYLTEKKQRSEAFSSSDLYDPANASGGPRVGSKSAPVSPVGSMIGSQRLQRAFSSISSTKHGSLTSSSNVEENIDQLEMLLEAYFVVIDNTLNKLLSLKDYIDDTEDLINIKLANIQNQLIKFELLLTAATFVATIFAVVTAVFGMNFEDTIFDDPSTFNWILLISGIMCLLIYACFLLYFRHKKVFPL